MSEKDPFENKRFSDALCQCIHTAINQMRGEFPITYAEVIGALEIVKSDVIDELRQVAEEGENGDDGDET